MIFSELILDLQNALKKDLAQIRFLLKKNPAMGYTRIVDIGKRGRKKVQHQTCCKFSKKKVELKSLRCMEKET